MNEYEEKNKKIKANRRKQSKFVGKIAFSFLLIGLGFFVPGSIIADALVKVPFITSEVAVLAAVVAKAGLGIFGSLKALREAHKFYSLNADIERLENEKDQVHARLEKRAKTEREKTKAELKALRSELKQAASKKKQSRTREVPTYSVGEVEKGPKVR